MAHNEEILQFDVLFLELHGEDGGGPGDGVGARDGVQARPGPGGGQSHSFPIMTTNKPKNRHFTKTSQLFGKRGLPCQK